MPTTIPALLSATAKAHGDRPAMRWKRGGEWQTATWRDYGRDARRVARALVALGVQPGQCVVVMGWNRPEWFLAATGAMHAGAVPVGVYTTITPDQVRYVAHHCEAVVAVVENRVQLETIQALRAHLPRLKSVVVMEGAPASEDVHGWDDFLRTAEGVPEERVDERLAGQKPDDLCTLIYTSGTTGPPKAVMISHRNVTWLTEVGVPHLKLTHEDHFLSYLPLSHIAEQWNSLYLPMTCGGCTWFAESLERLPEDLREARPTLFFGVPRVWEKIQARIQSAGAAASLPRRLVARWARAKGLAGGYAQQQGRSPPALYGLARRLVFDKVRERLGLDRARHCVTSAAPISLGTLEFFLSLGIPILEVYGMSEVTGPSTLSVNERYRTGRAGIAMPGSELRLAPDGENLLRGPHVFLGYLKDPAATAETLDAEGWVHSGDIGEIDADGFLRVTDRKKELLITSGGKNIAPAPIEAMLKTVPGIAQAVLLGDRRNYVAALLTLDPDRVAEVATRVGSPARDIDAARDCPAFRQYLEGEIARISDGLARYERIRKFAILPGELTVAGGELTPTMKLKRAVIRDKYAQEIERLYA